MGTTAVSQEEAWQKKQQELGISLSFDTQRTGVTILCAQSTPKEDSEVERNHFTIGNVSAIFQMAGELHYPIKVSTPIQIISETASDRIEMNGIIKKNPKTKKWFIKWNFDKDKFYE